jgi:hypothetical protein
MADVEITVEGAEGDLGARTATFLDEIERILVPDILNDPPAACKGLGEATLAISQPPAGASAIQRDCRPRRRR